MLGDLPHVDVLSAAVYASERRQWGCVLADDRDPFNHVRSLGMTTASARYARVRIGKRFVMMVV